MLQETTRQEHIILSTATMLKTAILLAVLQLAIGANLREFSFVLVLNYLHYEKQISSRQSHLQAK